MREWALTIILLLIGPSAVTIASAATCDLSDPLAQKRIDYINERYDDFFRYQQAKEEREARLASGIGEVKALREKHALELKRAAQEYKREKKDHAKEEALRVEWEKAQKERDKDMEARRICEVQQRRAAEQLVKKGRKIPELKEFDLEDH